MTAIQLPTGNIPRILIKTYCAVVVVVVVIQFLSGIVHFAKMAGFTPVLLQLVALHFFYLARFLLQTNLFPCPSLLRSFSLFLALTSRFRATLKTQSSSLLSTYPYHRTPFAVANRFIVFFNPSASICLVVFLSTTFQPHMALTIPLSVRLVIAFDSFFNTMFRFYTILLILRNNDKLYI